LPVPASVELSEAVLGQRRLIERLLVHGRRATGEEPSLRSPDAGDPEFVKNLQIFLRLVTDADALHVRAAHGLSGDERQAAAVLERREELRERITLPTEVPLTLELLLARRFELERLLLELGDRTYLAGRLADVYDEQPGTVSTWRSLYGDELPALLPGGVTGRPQQAAPPPGEEEVEATRARLARLMRTKESQSHLVKARWALKRRVAAPTILVLLLAVAAFALAVAGMVSDDQALRAATAAGAAGAALGGLIRLRDEVTLGTQARQFWLLFVGQVLVGAAAGVLTFLIDDGGLISVAGGTAGVAAVAFAVGFSEAAFVGLLGRLGGSLGGG
jgi:hypothetical protein